MRPRRLGFVAGVVAALCAPTGRTVAQSAAITSTATISGVALIAAAVNDLEFGTVLPGVPTTIDAKTSPSAGEFDIHGTRNAEIVITLLLPAELQAGAHVLPVVFDAQSGCQERTDKSKCKYFDPRVPLVARINNKAAPQNSFFVRIGGTVLPTAIQFPGVYQAPVTLAVAYTGT